MSNVRLRQTNKSRDRHPSAHPHSALSELARLLARQAAREAFAPQQPSSDSNTRDESGERDA